jgi:hypothetical protein
MQPTSTPADGATREGEETSGTALITFQFCLAQMQSNAMEQYSSICKHLQSSAQGRIGRGLRPLSEGPQVETMLGPDRVVEACQPRML